MLDFPAHFCKLAEETDVWTFNPLNNTQTFNYFVCLHIPILNP